MKLGVRGLLAVAATLLCACSSTPGAKSPGIDKAVAAVSIGAEVVHGADVACAAAGQELRAQGNAAKAADVTGKCVAALKPAADSLEAIAAGLDAGRVVSDQQIACAVALGLDALEKVRPVLADVGVKLPATVDTYARAAEPWLPLAEGAVCK